MNRRQFIRNLVASCAVAGMLMGLPMPKRRGQYYAEFRHAELPCDHKRLLEVIIFKRESDATQSSIRHPLSSWPA